MNRRIRSLTKTSSSSQATKTTKRDEGYYRYLKPGALAQLRNSRIRSQQKHQISLYRRVESVTTPSTNVVHHQNQIATIEGGFPCFTGRIYNSPRCPQRKKLVGGRSMFFLSSSPSSSPVADSPTPLMDVINTTDILVSH